MLVPVSGALESASAQGVNGSVRDLSAVQDLDVRHGRLSLRAGEIAVDEKLARDAGVRIGGRLRLRLPDGTKAAPVVVATYGRGLGLSQLTLGRDDLATHVTSAFDTKLWTRGGTRSGLAPLGTVRDRDGWSAARSLDRESTPGPTP
ncbi:hypothetical protein [Streptomyces collinus]|uniref:hypothetical protein n=1 Tax=Streptomyces collinus TaxID=42684 RepID=UPI003F540E85